MRCGRLDSRVASPQARHAHLPICKRPHITSVRVRRWFDPTTIFTSLPEWGAWVATIVMFALVVVVSYCKCQISD
jgi:hypothetical protein